jgi:hypothetical protein
MNPPLGRRLPIPDIMLTVVMYLTAERAVLIYWVLLPRYQEYHLHRSVGMDIRSRKRREVDDGLGREVRSWIKTRLLKFNGLWDGSRRPFLTGSEVGNVYIRYLLSFSILENCMVSRPVYRAQFFFVSSFSGVD